MCGALTGVRSSGSTLSGVTNRTSPSGSLMDESGFGSCQEDRTEGLQCAKCKVWWRGDYGVGLFFQQLDVAPSFQ